MSLCHGKDNLKELTPSKRKDRKERRFVCLRCGLYWQYTDHYYQVSRPDGNGIKKQRMIRLSDDTWQKIVKENGGLQAWVDQKALEDGYTPR